MTSTTVRPAGRPDPLLEALPVTYAHELTAMHRAGAAVFHALPDPTPAAALDVLVETVCDLLDVDYAGVHLIDRDVHRVPASSDTAADPTLPYRVGTDTAPVRFYAAAPLLDDTDRPVGTLCVIAHHPRALTGAERRTLLLLGIAASRLVTRCAPGVDG